MADKDADDYDSVAGMADRLGLEGKDRSQYIHRHMRGLGYRMQPSYVKADDGDDDDDDDDGFFPARKRKAQGGSSSSNRQSSSRGRRSRNDDDDDWY